MGRKRYLHRQEVVRRTALPAGNKLGRISPHRAGTLAWLDRAGGPEMRRTIACALAVALLAGCGLAGSAALADPPAGLAASRRRRLFLSPSGEPFRLGPNDPGSAEGLVRPSRRRPPGLLLTAPSSAPTPCASSSCWTRTATASSTGSSCPTTNTRLSRSWPSFAEGRFASQAAEAPSNAAPPPGPPQDNHPHGHPSLAETQANARPSSGASHPRPPQRTIAQLIDEPEPVSGADFNMDSHVTLAESGGRRRRPLRPAGQTAHSGRLTLEALRARRNARRRAATAALSWRRLAGD